MTWLGVGFSYVQVASSLHVLDAWEESANGDRRRLAKVDAELIDIDADAYIEEESVAGDISALTIG